jgi:hypothetical protein
MTTTPTKPLTRPVPEKFPLGRTVATPGALGAFEEAYGDRARLMAAEYLHRHQCGDWGNIHPGDEGLNDRALVEGTRILSVYILPGHSGCGQDETKIWIITEADRSYTTILLPKDGFPVRHSPRRNHPRGLGQPHPSHADDCGAFVAERG